MENRNKRIFFVLFCLIIAAVSVYPYFSMGVNIEHDTCFHLSRIQALAVSIEEGNLMPAVFASQNRGYGYASPLFYCNLFFLFPALLVHFGLSLARAYQVFLFVVTAITAMVMGICVHKEFRNDGVTLLSSCLYLFSLYRLSDIYVRGAAGEVLAFIFLPVAMVGIIEVVIGNEKDWPWLCVGFSGLLLTHNISFLMMVCVFGLILLSQFGKLLREKNRLVAIIKAVFWSIGLCSFFLWPMIEQMVSQKMIVHGFSGFDLENYALNAWQYTEQSLNFNTSSVDYGPNEAMTTNLGLLIPLLPLLRFFDLDEPSGKQKQLMRWMSWIGYGSFFLCSRLFPWEGMGIFGIIQFPWRLMIIADVMLVPLAALSAERFFHRQREIMIPVLICLTLLGAVIHLLPVMDRTLIFEKEAKYESFLDGSFIDPFYGDSYFVRTEIAGADYLPAVYYDYKNASGCVTDPEGKDLVCEVEKKGMRTAFEFENIASCTLLQVPLTYYKGYQAWIEDDMGNRTSLPISKNDRTGLVQVDNGNILTGKIEVIYTGTWIQKLSAGITIATLSAALICGYRKRRKSGNVQDFYNEI